MGALKLDFAFNELLPANDVVQITQFRRCRPYRMISLVEFEDLLAKRTTLYRAPTGIYVTFDAVDGGYAIIPLKIR